MPRSFRQSRFRRRGDLSEDVNPSAYIVNLADCMLVLACGFMVAMIVHWNIDITNVEQLENESLEEVDPETILEEIQAGGSYYIEAGTVYQDPNTGQLWMVRRNDEASAEGEGAATPAPADSAADGSPDTAPGAGAPSRAEGAD